MKLQVLRTLINYLSRGLAGDQSHYIGSRPGPLCVSMAGSRQDVTAKKISAWRFMSYVSSDHGVCHHPEDSESESQHHCVSEITGKDVCKTTPEYSRQPVEQVVFGRHPDAEVCFRYPTSNASNPDPCCRLHFARTSPRFQDCGESGESRALCRPRLGIRDKMLKGPPSLLSRH